MRYRVAAIVLALAAAVAIGQSPMYSDYPWGLVSNGTTIGPVWNLNCTAPLWCDIPSRGNGRMRLGDGGVLPISVAYAADAGYAQGAGVATWALDAGYSQGAGVATWALDAGFALASNWALDAGNLICTGCVDLATEVSGTLPEANGGTGTNDLPTCGTGYVLKLVGSTWSCVNSIAGADYASDAGNLQCSGCVALGSEVSGTLPEANGGTGTTDLPTCGTGYVLKHDGTSWSCVNSIAGSDYSSDAGNLQCSGCVALGSEVSGTLPESNGGTGTNDLPTCGAGYVLKHDGTSWSCVNSIAGADYASDAGNLQCSGCVALGSEVSGTLPEANGGTGTTDLPSCATGSVLKLVGTTWSCVNSIASSDSATYALDAGRADVAADVSCSGCVSLSTEVNGTLPAANGGTGQSSYTVGDIIYASAATTLARLADIATGNVLLSGGVGAAPAYGKVGLTTHVSGTLPVANGGTGVTTVTSCGAGQATIYNGTTWACTSSVASADYALDAGRANVAADLQCSGCVALGSEVSGTLPVANGGTGATSVTSCGAGYVTKFTGSAWSCVNAIANADLATLATDATNAVAALYAADAGNVICTECISDSDLAPNAVTGVKVVSQTLDYTKMDNGVPIMAWDGAQGSLLQDRITSVNGGTKSTYALSENRQFATITSTGTSDLYAVTDIKYRSDVKHVAVTYKTSAAGWSAKSTMRVYNNSNLLLYADATMYGDGAWHTAIFDVGSFGVSSINLRIDFQEGGATIASGRTIDIASVNSGIAGGSPLGQALAFSQGNVGIGLSNPAYKLMIGNVDGLYPTAFKINPSIDATSERAGMEFGGWVVGQDGAGNGTKDFFFYDGNLGASSVTRFGIATNGQLTNYTNSDFFTTRRYSADALGPAIIAGKSRNASTFGNTIVNDGDTTFAILAQGNTGSGFASSALIEAQIDGAPGASNDMPGRWVFYTAADGTATVTERMRIEASGDVGIGTSSPAQRLDVYGAAANIRLGSSTDAEHGVIVTPTGGTDERAYLYTSGGNGNHAGYLRLTNGNTDTTIANITMRNAALTTVNFFTNSGNSYFNGGNLGVGTTGPSEKLHVVGNIRNSALAGVGNRTVYSDQNGNLTNTGSDATLKTNVTTLERTLDTVLQLRPVRFNWRDTTRFGPQNEIGFVAQEVMELVPEVVGVNSDGTYTVDYPKLTAVLAGAVQELYEDRTWLARRVQALEDKLARLEARLAALEAKP